MKPSSQLLTLGLAALIVAACSDMTSFEPQLEPGGTERSGGGTKPGSAGAGGKKSSSGGGGTSGGGARSPMTTGGRPTSNTTGGGSNGVGASSGAGGAGATSGGTNSSAGSAGASPANAGAAARAGEENATGGGAGGASSEPLRKSPPFFSEYVEGTGSNKALELAIADAGRLDGCVIRVYANGALSASRSIALTGLLTPETPLVLCSPQLAATTGVICDYSESLPFNGNDAVLLWCDAEVVDSIGQLGADPGEAGWGSGSLKTQDRTLRRACTVTTGDRDPSDPFDLAADGWLTAAADAFEGLGTRCEPTVDAGAGGAGGGGAGGSAGAGAAGAAGAQG